MRTFVFLALLLVSASAYADWSSYIVEKPDGSVAIHNYNDESAKTLEQTLTQVGLGGLPFEPLDAGSALPARADRNFWKKGASGKVVIDSAKKQAKLNADAAKQAKRDSALAKLKITEAELADLLGGN